MKEKTSRDDSDIKFALAVLREILRNVEDERVIKILECTGQDLENVKVRQESA